ncbi:MAG: LapA family protein [Desulfovibrio sp.]|nr:LapA family protein [Desulfovibrio sp.]
MRYIKVLVLAVFLFLALIFFFQNQGPLSQEMEMTLNLFFIPPMTSIKLPFYFIVIAAFFVGAMLTLFWLVWDKFVTSSKLMKSKWNASRLEHEIQQLNRKLDLANERLASRAAEDAKKEPETAANAGSRALPASADAPVDERGHAGNA